MCKCWLILLLTGGCLAATNHKQLIESLYKDISGYTIPDSDEKTIVDHGGDSTYGEITYDGCKRLFKIFNLKKQDVFYDLGCGTGKCVVQVYLETPVKKVVGVEYAKSRYDDAMTVRAQLQKKGLIKKKRKLIFINGDIQQENFDDATAIFFNSLCFTDEFMGKIVDKFSHLKSGTRIATTKEFPERDYLVFDGPKTIKMSWDSQSTVYFYTIKHSHK